MCSTDDDLKQVVSTFSHQIPTIYDLKSIDDMLCAAMMKTTVLVGRELLSNNAILLPSVRDSFCEYTKELLRAANLQGEEEVEVNKLVSTRWILSNLIANLKHNISYTCQVYKYDTLLYRSDLLYPLTQASGKLRNSSTPLNAHQDPVSITQDTNSKVMVLDDLSKFIPKLK